MKDLKDPVENCLAFKMMTEFQENYESQPVIKGFKTEGFLDKLIKKWDDKIKYKDSFRKTGTLFFGLSDGSMLTIDKCGLGVATAEMIFESYVFALSQEESSPLADIKKEVARKLKNMKRR